MNPNRTIILIAALMIACNAFVLSKTGESDTQTKSFTVTNGGKFEVDTHAGGIHISTWEKNEVFIKVEDITSEDLEYLKMSQNGNIVSVEFHPKERKQFKLHFDISLPAEFNIDIKTGGGGIEIENKQTIVGKVRVNTGGGSIEIKDVNGNLELETGGGGIHSGSVKGDADISTGGGEILCDKISGSASIRTGGGDVRLGSIGWDLVLQVGGGSIAVEDIGGTAQIRTGGGDIKIGKIAGKGMVDAGGGNILVRGGNGELSASTGGGNVNMQNITGSVKARTGAGNINLELMPDEKGRTSLTTGAGNIELRLPQSAKADVRAYVKNKTSWKSDDSDIKSDFESSDKQKGKNRAEEIFTINGGGHDIKLETTVGKISIKKMKK